MSDDKLPPPTSSRWRYSRLSNFDYYYTPSKSLSERECYPQAEVLHLAREVNVEGSTMTHIKAEVADKDDEERMLEQEKGMSNGANLGIS